MIKVQALENFTLGRFDEIEIIERARIGTIGKINKNDIFKCEKDLAIYLLGANPLGRPVVKVIELEYVEDKNARLVTITEETKKVLKEKVSSKKKKASKK